MKPYLIPPSGHWHFHSILILPVKMVELLQQHANATAHCLQTLPLPIVAKSSILNVEEFLDLFLKTSPCMKTSPVLCENQSFFLLFANAVTFIVRWSISDQLFRWLLPLSWFYGPSQWFFKCQNYLQKRKCYEKVQSDSDMYVSDNFYQFSTLINLQHNFWYPVKASKHSVLSISSTDIFSS